MWRFLAPLMAARRSMRLSEPSDDGKFATSSGLKSRLPGSPAAVPLYNKHGRTVLLALDFDAKRHGAAQVDADVERILAWLHECGGRTVTDRSTSGGRHVLVPLPTDTPLRVEDLRELLDALEERLPTFDKSPMLGNSHGCISVPGSLCREGGHRRLDGPLAAAVEAFTLRSDHGVAARLVALLGGADARRSRPRTAVAVVEAALACEERLVGVGDDRRLHPRYRLTSAIPTPVATFARTGKITDSSRWPSPSEARQSVISSVVLRGASAADIEAALGTADYAGLRKAYARYVAPRLIAKSLRGDVAKALTWAASVAPQFRDLTHENKHTGGCRGTDSSRSDPIRRRWLAAAQTWIDQEFPGSRQRPILLAVVQALAYTSALAGELVEGVPVVAIGGRSLSHAAGLMSESTVWAALRLLRDTPGSPVLRVARGAGQLPDRYALTTPATAAPDSAAIGRARVEPVHQAWSVLGLRGRTIYHLIHSGQVSTVDAAFAAARVSRSTGYAILTDLLVAGLITRQKGTVGPGARSLDDVADAAGLDMVATERTLRHRAERLLWHAWLANRFGPPPPDRSDAHQRDFTLAVPAALGLDTRDNELIWAATIAAGPPPADPHLEALDLLSDTLGAAIIAGTS
ncbi:hypothetical protein C8K36_108243 [Rhodococcus sp. OK519]|uniref:hypothetical protein n=1 Tax=Rhodococcus sp. OK519 TaxID=2135729 RepID=UPI000D42C187|nr:hypothetical protein C8K36_108243 [Rhodococcus sp. OK519]